MQLRVCRDVVWDLLEKVQRVSGGIHEEANTRILFHAHHAAINLDSDTDILIMIKSPDTDIAVLACILCSTIPTLTVSFQTETKQRSSLFPIHSVMVRLGGVCTTLRTSKRCQFPYNAFIFRITTICLLRRVYN